MHEDLIALFPDLLIRYISKLIIRDGRARGVCPIHADAKAMSFSAHLGRGVWRCWSCGASGGVIDFARHIGATLPGHRLPLSPLHTVSESLQRKASATFREWSLGEYLHFVELLGSSPSFELRREAIAGLDRFDPNPMADETEARAEYALFLGTHP